jgi:hypothetical protein
VSELVRLHAEEKRVVLEENTVLRSLLSADLPPAALEARSDATRGMLFPEAETDVEVASIVQGEHEVNHVFLLAARAELLRLQAQLTSARDHQVRTHNLPRLGPGWEGLPASHPSEYSAEPYTAPRGTQAEAEAQAQADREERQAEVAALHEQLTAAAAAAAEAAAEAGDPPRSADEPAVASTAAAELEQLRAAQAAADTNVRLQEHVAQLEEHVAQLEEALGEARSRAAAATAASHSALEKAHADLGDATATVARLRCEAADSERERSAESTVRAKALKDLWAKERAKELSALQRDKARELKELEQAKVRAHPSVLGLFSAPVRGGAERSGWAGGVGCRRRS